jgi:hypothetical protein
MKNDNMDMVNARFRTLNRFPGLSSFSRRAQLVRRDPKVPHAPPAPFVCVQWKIALIILLLSPHFARGGARQRGTVTVAGFIGGEMDSFLQIAELLFASLIPDDELECWTLHINIVRQLEADAFIRTALNMLKDDISLFQASMVKLYGVGSEEGDPQSFAFPNFETASHWADQIHFLGPPWSQDTMLWERCHHPAKKTIERTNKRNCEKDVTRKVRALPPHSTLHFYTVCVLSWLRLTHTPHTMAGACR